MYKRAKNHQSISGTQQTTNNRPLGSAVPRMTSKLTVRLRPVIAGLRNSALYRRYAISLTWTRCAPREEEKATDWTAES